MKRAHMYMAVRLPEIFRLTEWVRPCSLQRLYLIDKNFTLRWSFRPYGLSHKPWNGRIPFKVAFGSGQFILT